MTKNEQKIKAFSNKDVCFFLIMYSMHVKLFFYEIKHLFKRFEKMYHHDLLKVSPRKAYIFVWEALCLSIFTVFNLINFKF